MFHNDRVWTYANLLTEGWRRVRHWQSLGLAPGARILLAPGDRLECLLAVIAGPLGGYELVPVSQKATSLELEHIRRITRPDLEWSAAPPNTSDAVEPPDTIFHNVRVTFFTSGTTSLPKGVCHNFESLLANAEAFNRVAGLDADVRMLHVMPTGYMAGLLNTFLSPLIAGGSVVLGEVFDARSAMGFWNIAQQHQVNALWLSPTMAATLTALSRGDAIPAWTCANVRHVFVGTAPLHPATRSAFRERFGVDCLESYGMTECMFVSVNPPAIQNPNGSVGLLLPGVEGETRTADGTALPAGSEGDLWLRSAYALTGYLDGSTGEPTPAVSVNRWLDTGDIGRLDADGRMTITGRRKDLIIRGGTNVSPKAVEDTLLGFPGVRDAAVVGVPHPYWGEEVVAYLIVEPGVTLDDSALRDYCATRMNADAVPSRCTFLTEFPQSSSGKVQKHLLRHM